MITSPRNQHRDDRYLLLVDTGEEDVAEILTVICDGHSSRDFDVLRAYGRGGAE